MARRRPSRSSGPRSNSSQNQAPQPFPSTKKDKQRIRHSQFVSKIVKSSSRSKKARSRRSNKNLVTSLDELVKALPDHERQQTDLDGVSASEVNGQAQIIKQKSLRSRPGALKRKDNLEKLERDRFTKNMAQMAAASPHRQETEQTTARDSGVHQNPQELARTASTAEKFVALRGFISQTMERRTRF